MMKNTVNYFCNQLYSLFSCMGLLSQQICELIPVKQLTHHLIYVQLLYEMVKASEVMFQKPDLY